MRTLSLAILGVLVSACGDPLVGGECAPGYVSVDQGACMLIGSTTNDAETPLSPDAAGDGAAMPTDASDGAANGDGSAPCALGESACGGQCVDLASSASNCGACGSVCSASQVCAFGQCAAVCPPTLSACGTDCIDVSSDPNNCGACGSVCNSGVCNGGACRIARAGHLVVIGHTYEQSETDQDRVLANAVFLSGTYPARVLAFDGYADSTSDPVAMRVNASLQNGAGARAWVETAASDPSTISSMLSIDRFDVMLLYPQSQADDEDINAFSWQLGHALTGFIRAGGVVVILDGASANSGAYPIANATGLLHVTGSQPIDNQVVSLVAGVDALAVGVSAMYRAAPSSVSFTGAANGAVFSVSSAPVVIHLAQLP